MNETEISASESESEPIMIDCPLCEGSASGIYEDPDGNKMAWECRRCDGLGVIEKDD